MTLRLFAVSSLILALVACSADADDDGVTNGDEKDLGTDPENPDSDGDGLTDGEEVALGTDGNSPDSDGDGYLDPYEVAEGSDPADASSGIYQGGWPYNPDKDSLVDPGWDGDARVGSMLPRIQWMDQYGDTVDVYDFAMQGKPVVIDLSGLWCGWCQEVAKFLDGEPTAYTGQGYDELPDIVARGDVYWITVVDSDYSGAPADEDDLLEWWDLFPNPDVTLLLDTDTTFAGWLNPTGYPTMILVEEDMSISISGGNYYSVWDDVIARYGE
jgi:hypothetical protein